MNRQTRIAVAGEFKKLAAKAETEEKQLFLQENPVGQRLIVTDDLGNTLGSVAVRKPSKPSDRVEITDEHQALAWAIDEFGTGVYEEVVRLTPQGRASVIAAAKSFVSRGMGLPPGVELVEGQQGSPTVAWTAEKGVDVPAVFRDMAKRGVLDITEVLEVEA